MMTEIEEIATFSSGYMRIIMQKRHDRNDLTDREAVITWCIYTALKNHSPISPHVAAKHAGCTVPQVYEMTSAAMRKIQRRISHEKRYNACHT